MKLCVIPARGGSKRIPRKNIRPFAGKPMIAWAIEAALRSGLFDRTVVSTDDCEIKNIASDYGAETPFLRPAELSDDHTPTVPVIRHAITSCEESGGNYDFVCCIYACVPFIEVNDLRLGLDLLQQRGQGFTFPVTEFPSAIQRALKLAKNGTVSPFYPEFTLTRTQDLERAYYDVGQFYWGTRNSWMSIDRIYAHGVGIAIPPWRGVDIDTQDDWERAEKLISTKVE